MRTLLLTACLLLTTTLFAQIDTAKFKLAAKAQSEAFWSLYKNNDFEGAIDALHPKYVEFRGGKENILTAFKENMAELAESGHTIATIRTGIPGTIYKQGNEYQCLVPVTMQIDINASNVNSEISIVAISEDGKQWKYVMLDGEEVDSLRKAVDIHAKIVLKAE